MNWKGCPFEVLHMNSKSTVAIVLAILGTPMAYAQTPTPPKPQSSTPKPAPAPTADLERRVRVLEAQVRGLQERVQYKGASLDCNSKVYTEFQFLDSTLVFFAVCTNIEPYLEGHKVTVKVNNPYGVRFSGIEGTLGYGKTQTESFEKTVDISTVESLAPGEWTTFVTTINPSKPEDLRFVELNLTSQNAGGR
jgi:hypothetical protein